ncbi:MAG: hypothetical protein COT74_10385 [Bdellovibrionales bacterium CG10_big_fil_rev_8_21_14_0_10_45_34]|nr:MAG: hypothetical protein COT74_10385 [Bdellovibrionales bacterium CG10_big_fil_rev_8_21_14_0_10_45_34]
MKKRFISEFCPRFSDFDMQGILNSRIYLDLLAEARLDQMVRCYGRPLDYYAKKNASWVLSSLTIDFRRPVYYGNKIRVETEVVAMEGAVATVDFAIGNDNISDRYASGKANYHLVDLATKRPITIGNEDIEIFLSKPS